MLVSPGVDVALFGVLGLLVGSFLNVVIHRLPKMMELEWAANCAELAGKDVPAVEPFNLSRPRSRCPSCQHQIRWYENIPVLSFAVLRGRCAKCKTSISVRYPVIEIVTAVFFVAMARMYGPTAAGLVWAALACLLIAQFCIDLDPAAAGRPQLHHSVAGPDCLCHGIDHGCVVLVGVGRRFWLPEPLVGLPGAPSPHWQARHGARRLQAARGPGRLVWCRISGRPDPVVICRGLVVACCWWANSPIGIFRSLSAPSLPAPAWWRCWPDPVDSRAWSRLHSRSRISPDELMLRLGLTGGIGSGKSTVAEFFTQHRAVVIDADAISRATTASGGLAIAPIAAAFGADFITADGALDRARMRQASFSDPAARATLESIVHPLVAQESALREQNALDAGAPCIVFDVPLLVESRRWRQRVDLVLVVDCLVEVQISRVMARSP